VFAVLKTQYDTFTIQGQQYFFHRQIGLKFGAGSTKMLHLELSILWVLKMLHFEKQKYFENLK
jgi:hypothetical protein